MKTNGEWWLPWADAVHKSETKRYGRQQRYTILNPENSSNTAPTVHKNRIYNRQTVTDCCASACVPHPTLGKAWHAFEREHMGSFSLSLVYFKLTVNYRDPVCSNCVATHFSSRGCECFTWDWWSQDQNRATINKSIMCSPGSIYLSFFDRLRFLFKNFVSCFSLLNPTRKLQEFVWGGWELPCWTVLIGNSITPLTEQRAQSSSYISTPCKLCIRRVAPPYKMLLSSVIIIAAATF